MTYSKNAFTMTHHLVTNTASNKKTTTGSTYSGFYHLRNDVLKRFNTES